MEIAINPPNSSKSRVPAKRSFFQRFSFRSFSFTQTRPIPHKAVFPATRLFQRPSSQKQIPSSHKLLTPLILRGRAYATLAVATIFNATCAASTFLVTTTADSGSGSLRQAILNANSNPGRDTIAFAGTTFTDATVPDFIDLASTLPTVTTEITIVGPGADKLMIRRPAGATSKFRIMQVLSGGNLELSDVTITGGDRNGVPGSGGFDGGGIYSQFSTLTLKRTKISGNMGGNSAGIYAVTSNLSITDCLISGNTAAGAGGGMGQSGSDITMLRSTVSGNTAGRAGGILANGGTLQMIQCSVSGNTATGYPTTSSDGGAFFSTGCALTLVQCTISGNTADRFGGGIFQAGGPLTLVQSTISGNRSKDGGGIWIGYSSISSLYASNVKVLQSTVCGNTATGIGGGIYGFADQGSLNISNSIVCYNTGADVLRSSTRLTLTLEGKNLVEDASLPAGTNVINGDPLLGSLHDNGGPTLTHAPLAGSPVIDTGGFSAIPADTYDLDGDLNTSETTPLDQRGLGFIRVFGTAVDIGAYEVSAFEPTLTSTTTIEDTQSTTGLVITSNAGDESLTSHYKITGILNGTLYQNDGTSLIAEGGFITKAQGAAGLKFLPGANLNSLNTANFGFTAQAAVSASDQGLRGLKQSAAVSVTPVNDAPIVTSGGLPDQLMLVGQSTQISLLPYFTDVDQVNLAYGILTNSDPGKLSATVVGSTLHLSSLAIGVVNLTVKATDDSGASVSDAFSINIRSVNPTPVQLTTTGTLNKQNGLFEFIVNVTNTTPFPINGFRLHVDYATYLAAYPSLKLYNASSPIGSKDVYVDHPYPVAVDATVAMKLYFYTSTRTFPNPFTPLLTSEILPSSAVSDTDGKGVQPRVVMMADGNVLLEFPSLPLQWYRIRYSPDLINWFDCPVPIQGTANRTQWIDSGPPFTRVPPSEAPVRYYRVNEIPVP